MATFFGIEESCSKRLSDRGVVCIAENSGTVNLSHSVASTIKREDVIFIKHSTSSIGLQVKAVGIVRSDYCIPEEEEGDVCMPVEWVWRGERNLKNFDEEFSIRDDPLYEEHDIQVQREIIDLMPSRFQLPQEW